MKEDLVLVEQLPKITVPAVQVILLREGDNGFETFLGRRNAGGFLDQWTFPGGVKDPGESDKFAASREFFEETGEDIPEDRLFHFMNTDASTVREIGGMPTLVDYDVTVFTANGQGRSPRNASPREHSEMGWMTFGDALTMHRRAVRRALISKPTPTPDRIPGALTPGTHGTVLYLARANVSKLAMAS